MGWRVFLKTFLQFWILDIFFLSKFENEKNFLKKTCIFGSEHNAVKRKKKL